MKDNEKENDDDDLCEYYDESEYFDEMYYLCDMKLLTCLTCMIQYDRGQVHHEQWLRFRPEHDVNCSTNRFDRVTHDSPEHDVKVLHQQIRLSCTLPSRT